LAQICAKSFVGWGFAPDPTGELTVLPRHPSWFRGGTAWGRGKDGGEGKGKGKGQERRGREGKGGGGDKRIRGETGHPHIFRWIDAFGIG